MTQLRITPEEVLAAYDKTGLFPACRSWSTILQNGQAHTCGCPMTALYVAEHPDDPQDEDENGYYANRVQNWGDRKYGMQYCKGFVWGVDQRHLYGRHKDHEHELHEQGFADGCEVWLAMLGHFTKIYLGDEGFVTETANLS